MATISSVPTELLHQVCSYLAPFDQVALSATSKSFHATIEPCIRLDQVSQHIYLSLNLKKAKRSAPNFLINHPVKVRTLLRKTYDGIYPSPKFSKDYGRYMPSPPASSVQRELLQPYFPDKPFPQCTIAHYYFSTINRFAELVGENSLGGDLGDMVQWALVGMDSERYLQRLEKNLAKMMKATKSPAAQ